MNDPIDDKPGSPEAIDKGCTCSPRLNCNGEGVLSDHGPIHFAKPDCPLHGAKLRNGFEFTRSSEKERGSQ
jgi:hypothetical protein